MLISDIKVSRRRLDFSSSGQGSFTATEVYSGNSRLVNAIELLDFSDGLVQVLVCEACGISGCEPGSWVAIRRVGETVVFVPAVDAMQEDDWGTTEYSPPEYMKNYGPLVFGPGVYEDMRAKTGRFPKLSNLKDIASREVLAASQLTAPGRVLGPLGTLPELDPENIVAVTEGDLDDEIAAFGRLISTINDGADGLHAESLQRVVEFHLNVPTFPAWRPFGYDSDRNPVLNTGETLGQAPAR